MNKIKKEGSHDEHRGFNLIVGDLKTSKCAWFCNVENKEIEMLHSGIHGLSNRTLCIPWPKVVYGKGRFQDILQTSSSKNELLSKLFELLSTRLRHFPNEDNSNYFTLLDEECKQPFKDACRSIFVNLEPFGYGTRTQTVILVDSSDHVTFVERNLENSNTGSPDFPKWITHTHEFDLAS